MKTTTYWIETLGLTAHPEGGWFKETYRAAESIPGTGLPARFGGDRSFATAIYFLLKSGQGSSFHRIKSDELWFFHDGAPVMIHTLSAAGEHRSVTLGPDPGQGQVFQTTIPAESWFGAQVLAPDTYSLVSCTVAPGFDFADFELAERDQLLRLFPRHRELILRLTHERVPIAGSVG